MEKNKETLCKETWYCYILRSTLCDQTYNGSTNDLTRRLRQHNGEISGGAKATHLGRPHEFICYLSGFSNHIIALRCEWWIKHPTGARKRPSQFSKPNGRIRGLNFLFQSKKWTEKFDKENLILHIKSEFKDLLVNVPNNVKIELI